MDKKILFKAQALCEKNNIIFFDLGRVGYNQVFKLQEDLFKLVSKKECLGFLLLLEHEPVITIGSNRSLKNLTSDRKVLEEKILS